MRIVTGVLCLLLAGCGGKGGNPKIRIANQGPGLQTWCLPVLLAQSLGYYKEEGLDVEIEILASAPKMLHALIGGSVDMSTLTYWQTIQMAAEGQRLRSIFIMDRGDSKVLVVSPAAANRIRTVADLKGATIGVTSPGSSTHLFVNSILAANGMKPADVTAVGIGVGASAVAAVESGRVDAASLTGGDHFPLLHRHPDLRILVDLGKPEWLRMVYGGEVYATGAVSAKQEWLDRNPDAARRVARALARTHRWIASHRAEEVLALVPEGARSPDPALDLEILRWGMTAYTADGKMPAGAPEALLRYVRATIPSVGDKKIDLAATWTDEYLPEGK